MKTGTYSIYQAKAHFSEIIRKVLKKQRVVITYRGEKVAQIIAIEKAGETLGAYLKRLTEEGALHPAQGSVHDLLPLVSKPGALKRFLDQREED